MPKAKTKATTKVKPKKRACRPTNFGKVNPRAVELLCRRGFTDKEIGMCLHVTLQTWTLWKKKNTELFASLKDWKHKADTDIVRSLYERGKGYNHPETKAQWVTDDILVDSEWKKVGRWEYAEMIKHYPPDPTSMIFWLKNRDKKNWRDKVEHEHDVEPDGPLAQFLTIVAKQAKRELEA